MSLKITLAVTVAALSLSTGQAWAESEGNGDPFPFQAGHQVTAGSPFVADTGSAAYPQLTENTTQPSSLPQLEPAPGSEALIQTAGSLPRGFGDGSVAHAQARGLSRYLADRLARTRHLEAGSAEIKG